MLAVEGHRHNTRAICGRRESGAGRGSTTSGPEPSHNVRPPPRARSTPKPAVAPSAAYAYERRGCMTPSWTSPGPGDPPTLPDSTRPNPGSRRQTRRRSDVHLRHRDERPLLTLCLSHFTPGVPVSSPRVPPTSGGVVHCGAAVPGSPPSHRRAGLGPTSNRHVVSGRAARLPQ